ncbi:MAG: hypothetical protein CMI18_12220 [Opitutaceae bacterium]|nr:hypothetical protein [Opitutaceae bacterium]
MKNLLLIIAASAFSTVLFAGEANTVTLEGTGTCAKCSLKTADSCTNVLEVAGTDGKPVIFEFAKNIEHGAYFCRSRTPGLVVKGTIQQVDGKLVLAATSVENKDS